MRVRMNGGNLDSSGYAKAMPSMFLYWILVLLPGSAIDAIDIAQCNIAMGMQTGQIPDGALSASSTFDAESVGPTSARIRTELHGGAWCPDGPIDETSYEYLQISFSQLKVVTLVETQGRFGNGQGQEFADQYVLEYQREDDGPWFRFRNRRGQEIFQGNMNTYMAELREVNPPVIAKRLRFVPYSTHPRTVCMRVELYGCSWQDGSVMYNGHQGVRRGTEVDLYDFTYDGTIQDGRLSGGMGQLTDGEIGETNFRLDPSGSGIKGYEWVGWRNDSLERDKPVELVFKFDKVRNFTFVRIHVNNMFSKDVRVFKMAKIFFSIGGKYYLQQPIEYAYMRDTLIEYARLVTMPLKHNIGRFVKIQLFFDSRWLMISEVSFESEYAVGNFTEEMVTTTAAPKVATSDPVVQVIDVVPHEGRTKGQTRRGRLDTGQGQNGDRQGQDGVDKTLRTPAPGDSTTDEVNHQAKSLDDQYIGIIIGVLTAVIILLFTLMIIIIMRQRKRKYHNHQALKIDPTRVTLNDLHNGTLNGKANGVLSPDLDSFCKYDNREIYNGSVNSRTTFGNPQRVLPDRPKTPTGESTDTNLSRDYAVPDVTKSALISPTIPVQPQTTYSPNLYGRTPSMGSPYHALPSASGAPPPYMGGSHYASSEVVPVQNIQGVSGSNVYAAPNLDLLWKDDFSLMEFPKENLKFLEKLGEGQFGEVHLCEAEGMNEFLGEDSTAGLYGGTTGGSTSSSVLVAVKTLICDANEQTKRDFQKEVHIMSQLKDPNIVRVLGIVTAETPWCVIVEYMKFGDLNQFLQTHVPDWTGTKRKGTRQLSYGTLIYMANQVASGMKYLESLNMVHRDLATRNCLVGSNYSIKISDFGMSRSLYSTDYYRIEGRAVLPIRWMAWESILLGKFSTKSDTWSFGVTLWEVLTFAKEQPFDEMTDEQVIENCGHYYRNDGLEQYLPQPSGTPREIYDLMRECWNRDEIQRPTFREINMFLQRKNMGYDPVVESDYQRLKASKDREVRV